MNRREFMTLIASLPVAAQALAEPEPPLLQGKMGQYEGMRFIGMDLGEPGTDRTVIGFYYLTYEDMAFVELRRPRERTPLMAFRAAPHVPIVWQPPPELWVHGPLEVRQNARHADWALRYRNGFTYSASTEHVP